MNEQYLRNVVEAGLLASSRSLALDELAALFGDNDRPSHDEIREALAQLSEEYAARALELKETASGVRIQVRREFATEVSRLWPERPKRYSRALLETLALIAYRQPITRAEIEDIRGVAISKGTLDTLLEIGWVRMRGRRKTPGRPVTYGTTDGFLAHFGLNDVMDLPGLQELKGAGLLEANLPPGFDMPIPRGGDELRADEEPLDGDEQAPLEMHLPEPVEEGDSSSQQ